MVSLRFHDFENKSKHVKIYVYDSEFLSNGKPNTISLTIQEPFTTCKSIHLDKSTAIKLSKELRKQIALLD